jgi:hypothetical protein
MAFFSLTDIKYVSGQNRDSEFALNGNSFDAYNRRYPIDIGNTDKGHYMTFFIFTQERTQVEGYQQGGFMLDPSGGNATVLDTPSQNALGAVQFIAEELIGDNRNREVDESVSVKENPNFFETFKNSSAAATLRSLKNSEVGQNLLKRGNFFRTINRTKDSISLYMPDTLAFDYAQSYSDLSVTADLGNVGLGLSAAASIYDQRKSGVSNQIKNAAPFAAEFAKNKLGSNGGQTLFSAVTAATGGALAVNPQLELIYQGTGFRSFRFSFMFYPRSKKEAEEVLGIIDSFTFHQAPEVLSSSFGRYLVPPSEFDIKFYCNGKENPNIPKMTTSVLTGISVDYAPSGFASYETLLMEPERGGTGMPVAIRMDLSFKETEIITKRFLKGQKEEAYKSPFRGDEAINGLDFGNESSGELRTQAEIDASRDLGDFNETGITFENTATSDTEFDLANGSWGTEDTTGIDDTGSGGTIGGA